MPCYYGQAKKHYHGGCSELHLQRKACALQEASYGCPPVLVERV